MEKWLGETLREFANSEHLSDCHFIIEAADGKKCFKCHKFIFICASNVFERMFNGDFLESKSAEIVLKNVRPEILAKFREYLYNYDTKLLEGYDVNTLIDLTKFGHQYMVTSITEECIKILFQRNKNADILMLIQLYQFGNDILREDFIKDVSENLTYRFPTSLNHKAIYDLSSDVFLKYVETSKVKVKEAMRFYMIETYLKINGFDMSKVISIPSADFDADDANKEDRDLEQLDQGENELVDNNELEVKSNVSNEDKKETIQNVKFEKVKNAYMKNLLKLIDYKKMTPEEFYNGPGKSHYFDMQEKYDMLCATISP